MTQLRSLGVANIILAVPSCLDSGLAYFNQAWPSMMKGSGLFYRGLPVTYSALIFPLDICLSMAGAWFRLRGLVCLFVDLPICSTTAVFFAPKPNKLAYLIFAILAVAV